MYRCTWGHDTEIKCNWLFGYRCQIVHLKYEKSSSSYYAKVKINLKKNTPIDANAMSDGSTFPR